MNSSFIAAVIAMAIMTTFSYVILRVITVNTGNKIRDHVITQMETYDVLVKRKSAELEALHKQIEREQKQSSNHRLVSITDESPPYVFLAKDVEYRSSDFSSDYINLKSCFHFDRIDIERTVKHINDTLEMKPNSLVMDRLLEKLSFDNVYKIAILNPKDQFGIVQDILETDEQKLLEEFLKAKKEFDVTSFYHWLYVRKQFSNKEIKVKVADIRIIQEDFNSDVKFELDTDLCEGFQIYVGNKIYDYGIQKSELLL